MRIKVIATTVAKRDPLMPELPTVADTISGFESTLWWGIALPTKTPAIIVKILHGEIAKAMQSPEAREVLSKQSVTAHAEPSAQFMAFIKAERERIAHVGRQVSITLD